MNPRAVATKVICDVVNNGVPLNEALPAHTAELSRSTDQALLQELSYGVLRWWFLLVHLVEKLLQKPLKTKDFDVFCLILVGLYQIRYSRVPAHAAVSETVAAVRQLKKTWADKLLNAVLRRYLREWNSSQALDDLPETVRQAHPGWLTEKLQRAWPEHWIAIIEANNQRPPMTLRVNRRQTNRDNYLQQLTQAAMPARAARYCPDSIILEQPVAVENLPGFAQGVVSVQDSAAQLAALLLDLQPGLRVLDVCAAPGGKTGHILECEPQLAELMALDVGVQRLQLIDDNLRRLGLRDNPAQTTLVHADATETQQWWDGNPFDRILLDAPCTATGVIRRHPDIKVLRKPQDVHRVVALQAKILDSVWPLLKPGGKLLYATCSVLPEENEYQVAAFVERHHNAYHQSLDGIQWGLERPYGRQIFPGVEDMDGFYYACVVKTCLEQ